MNTIVEKGLHKLLNANLQVLEVALLKRGDSVKAKTSAKMTQIRTLAQVTIRVLCLHVHWSWANVNGIQANDNYEKSWFVVLPWVPKGKGVQGEAHAQHKVKVESMIPLCWLLLLLMCSWWVRTG